jgi:hypothetical protein
LGGLFDLARLYGERSLLGDLLGDLDLDCLGGLLGDLTLLGDLDLLPVLYDPLYLPGDPLGGDFLTLLPGLFLGGVRRLGFGGSGTRTICTVISLPSTCAPSIYLSAVSASAAFSN